MTRNVRRNHWTTIVGSLLGCTLPISAQAEPITFSFGGTITEILDDNDFLDAAVSVGDDFSGSYTFDSSVSDYFPNDDSFGSYFGAIVDTSGEIAGLPFDFNSGYGGSIWVMDGFGTTPADGYEAVAGVNLGGVLWSLTIDLTDETSTAFATDGLPTMPLNLGDFSSRYFELYSEQEGVLVSGQLDTLTPEPNTLFVLLAGAGIALRIRCR